MNVVNLKVELSNPFSDRWASLYDIGGSLSKHKRWEFQVMKTNTIVEMSIHLNIHCDHAGLNIDVGLLGYSANLIIHDTRHWDYEFNKWEVFNE